MGNSKVYFTDVKTSAKFPLVKKMESVVTAAGIEGIDFNKKFVAIKIHFGEPGNLAFLRPNFAAKMSDMIRSFGGKPFLTDCNTLYSGGRSNAVDHLKSAMENGYNPISAKCDIIIADGLKGTDYKELPVEGGKYFKKAKIGAAIADADILITMSHFKGHEQTGFGGALKNIGMGSASVGGKLELHSSSKPVINRERCTGCNICVKYCAHHAVTLDTSKLAVIDYEKCVGCGQCVALCQFKGAVVKDWDTSEVLNAKIAEYSKALLNTMPSFHINFILNVSPNCDCWSFNEEAIVSDIGIAASFDPVALDQACADLVKQAPLTRSYRPSSEEESGTPIAEHHCHEGKCSDGKEYCGEDKFQMVHPDTNWRFGLEYAEEIGIGSRKYELIKV